MKIDQHDRRVSESTGDPLIFPSIALTPSIGYPIPTKKAVNVLATALGSMGDADYLLSDDCHTVQLVRLAHHAQSGPATYHTTFADERPTVPPWSARGVVASRTQRMNFVREDF
ncbi:hypothetical protein EVAR_25747_1 [Eumeta japonica]|uniref:Uncharacterized protein n=1 Tax=Eumeta variegata TaxID=151549 RepID=A0A4C1V7E2_EUMVA|nr:hypothetical protein EVAR_25747_1 [Eumeta japonica]